MSDIIFYEAESCYHCKHFEEFDTDISHEWLCIIRDDMDLCDFPYKNIFLNNNCKQKEIAK